MTKHHYVSWITTIRIRSRIKEQRNPKSQRKIYSSFSLCVWVWWYQYFMPWTKLVVLSSPGERKQRHVDCVELVFAHAYCNQPYRPYGKHDEPWAKKSGWMRLDFHSIFRFLLSPSFYLALRLFLVFIFHDRSDTRIVFSPHPNPPAMAQQQQQQQHRLLYTWQSLIIGLPLCSSTRNWSEKGVGNSASCCRNTTRSTTQSK